MSERHFYRQGSLFEDSDIESICPTCGRATFEAVIAITRLKGKRHFIKVRDISAITSDAKYSEIFTRNEGSIGLISVSLRTFIANYPRDFMFAHRKVVVRPGDVVCVHPNPKNPSLHIAMVKGVSEPLPISRRLYRPLVEKLLGEGKRNLR